MKDYNKEKKWYIATTITGSEEKIRETLMEKIIAYKFQQDVSDMKIIKNKEVTIEEFDDVSNPPPKTMRNSKYIEWRTTPKGYEKITTKEINRFPGYLFINMVMSQDVWYAIRNTAGITGFVGSSGKGTQPIPISEFELKNIFDEELNKTKIIRISGKSITEEEELPINNVEASKKSVNVEYFDSKAVVSSEKSNEAKQLVELSNQDDKESLEQLASVTDNFVNSKPIDNNYEVGNEVIIINGTLIGSTGLVKAVDKENQKLSLEVDLMGEKRLLDFDWKDVVK